MTEDWAKNISSKISAFKDERGKSDPRSARILKAAEEAREFAADILFQLFIEKLNAITDNLERGKVGFFNRFFKKEPSVLDYSLVKETVFRFEARESKGCRLEIGYNRGSVPGLIVDVASAELIDGEYRPFFREFGAVAGSQIWFERRSEGKHPELVSRLFFLLSAAALDDEMDVLDATSWVYEESYRPINSSIVEGLIGRLIDSA